MISIKHNKKRRIIKDKIYSIEPTINYKYCYCNECEKETNQYIDSDSFICLSCKNKIQKNINDDFLPQGEIIPLYTLQLMLL